MRIWPLYDGSVRLSGYPIMPVLKTTSPAQGRCAPNDSPESFVPSLRTRVAIGIGGIVFGGKVLVNCILEGVGLR